MKRWIALGIAACAARAGAGPLADALEHRDIAALRTQLADLSARCTLGAIYEQRDDVSRAQLFLDGCDDAALAPDIADAVEHAIARNRKKLTARDLSSLSIVSDPPGMIAETDALPGERLTTPVTLWLRAGTYQVRTTALDGTQIASSVALGAHSRGSVVLGSGAGRSSAPHAGSVSFEEQGDVGDHEAGPPPDAKHKPMMPDKFITGGTTGGPQIDDPLAAPPDRPPPAPPVLALGARIGAGTYSEGIGPALSLVATVRAPWQAAPAVDPLPVLLVLRAEWSKHGDPEHLAAAAGIAKIVAAADTAWIALGAELRADRELVMPRNDLGAALRVGLALRRIPITLDAAYEQGLTSPGERAVVIEGGFELRAN